MKGTKSKEKKRKEQATGMRTKKVQKKQKTKSGPLRCKRAVCACKNQQHGYVVCVCVSVCVVVTLVTPAQLLMFHFRRLQQSYLRTQLRTHPDHIFRRVNAGAHRRKNHSLCVCVCVCVQDFYASHSSWPAHMNVVYVLKQKYASKQRCVLKQGSVQNA